MEKYIHKVQYYETDKMGITHHSNYIRWMEEARVDFFEKAGYEYSRLEEEGIISPVVAVECNYKISTKFEDVVEIEAKIREFKGVKLVFEYAMKNQKTGEIVAECRSKHCFVNHEGRPIILKKEFPELDQVLKNLIEE
ncbi:MAG: acyl-CoA thioesterase [Clostridia bacterium]|nr:acyl-CoA thioesterase [Clostridia bacterium]